MKKFFERHWWAPTVVGLAAALVICVAVGLVLSSVKPKPELPKLTGNGQPLDAIVYRAPVFADGERSFRVHDRQTGDTWWLIEMDGQWVALTRTHDAT